MTSAYIDIEGVVENILEIGIVYAREGKILRADICYGKITDYVEFYRGRYYAHGLNKNFLSKHGYTHPVLLEKIHQELDFYEVSEICGNGEDIKQLRRALWVDDHIDYRNIPLPVWDERIVALPHLQAWSAKLHSLHIASAYCNYHAVHNYNLCKHKKLTKDVFGAHCALYDAYELALFDNVSPLH